MRLGIKGRGRGLQRRSAQSYLQRDFGIWLCRHHSRRDKPSLSLAGGGPLFKAVAT